MADTPDDKTPEAIKKHQQTKTHEMPGPMGSSIRQDMANRTVAKDQERFSNRAEKYDKLGDKSIADKENVREGTRGNLSKEFNKQNQPNKEMER